MPSVTGTNIVYVFSKSVKTVTYLYSKLQTEGCPAEEQASHTVTYSPGDKVTVYSMKVGTDSVVSVCVSTLVWGKQGPE